MPLKIQDLGAKLKLPELPKTVAVPALSAPSLGARRDAIARLGEQLQLGELRPVELDHGVVMAGERGEIEYFHASGAVWVRDATATDSKNELRKWPDLQEGKSPGQRAVLSPEASKRLIIQARELLTPLGLIGQEVVSGTVALDQVARLDTKGNEVSHGAGQATVKFTYGVEGIPVRGAGAKTLLFAEPARGQARVAGAFHAWRTVGESRSVKLPPVEKALAVGLLDDPELMLYQRAGHKIQVKRLELTYVALPAFVRQTSLFPMFQVEGEVSAGKRGPAFRFARYHHAVPPANYRAAGLFDPYLAVNPDGIVGRRAQRKA